ncbi:hypothetical protein ACK8P5_26080 (plasmid) [Paenibacillus sp. EC2-1]|uniref:hypothetical protein n=1 Tax=Paenibacillus sp. EC2-1 TaxID=3388665 RepID=UPI003BEF0AAB
MRIDIPVELTVSDLRESKIIDDVNDHVIAHADGDFDIRIPTNFDELPIKVQKKINERFGRGRVRNALDPDSNVILNINKSAYISMSSRSIGGFAYAVHFTDDVREDEYFDDVDNRIGNYFKSKLRGGSACFDL